MTDTVNQPKGFLSKETWHLVQHSVPIACADIIAYRFHHGVTDLDHLELGLILRDTPSQGKRWCMIGGRILLDEPVAVAVQRQMQDALGDSLQPVTELPPPLLVEFGREYRDDTVYDLRQHAISLTHVWHMRGAGKPRGDEALDFRWWPINDLGPEVQGFGQEHLIPRVQNEVLRQLRETNEKR